MTINCSHDDFIVKDGLWAGRTLYDLYSEAFTPFEWHEELFSHAKKCGITLLSTPFDESAVDLLESLETPAYKVASFELVDLPLIKYIAMKNKPILLSTGMASMDEISEAVGVIRENSTADLLLFHCVSSYPAVTRESNLNNLLWLKQEFDAEVGLSDHTISNTAAVTAIGMGAVAIEKHFKLDDTECGPDSSFSLSISQLKDLVNQCNDAWLAKGRASFQRSHTESQNLVFRRSLYFVKQLKKGDVITPDVIRRIRPGFGLAPRHLPDIIGRKVTADVSPGAATSWELISRE